MSRSATIGVSLTYAEKEEIERRAKRSGKKPAVFLRDCSLQGFIPPPEPTDEELCAEGKHDWLTSTSGLASYCRRPNCDVSWEYD